MWAQWQPVSAAEEGSAAGRRRASPLAEPGTRIPGMPLPILQGGRGASRDDLIRLFHRTELLRTRHLAEEAPLDVGTGFSNPALPRVSRANRVLDAALPAGMAPTEAIALVRDHYASQGVACRAILLNPAAPADRTVPLATHLVGSGWRTEPSDVLARVATAEPPARRAQGLTVIPARASFRHARALAEAAHRKLDEPQWVDAALMHLDDPHWDALLALREGAVVGGVAVLAAGDVGRVDQLFVVDTYRRRGTGAMLMERALEICARSMFRHVMLEVAPGDLATSALAERYGFRKVGEVVQYHAPA